MSTAFELNTQPRDAFGTNASRRLRRSEQVPAMVYGAGKDNEALVLDHNEIMQNLGIEAFHSAIISLNTESGAQQVILREVQRHRYKPRVTHVDFQRIKATEKLHIKVPIHFEGADEAPGVKVDEGIFSNLITELDITCLPKDLPEYIAVDVSGLGINETIHLSEVQLPEGVELTGTAALEGEDPTIATVAPPRVIEEDEITDVEEDLEGVEGEDAGDSAAPEGEKQSGDADSAEKAQD